VIEVQHLTKRYGRVTAVDDVSFKVEPGEILGFLGPNGAGKTTTMRILTGYMPASEGRATVAGYDVFTHPIDAKRRTGYLPETPPLYPDMTVREYLDFVARIKGVPSGERKGRVDAVMQRTHVADMAGRHCGKLSKGYRQRVGLADALVSKPRVLVLDEPTAGMDPNQIREVRDLIRSLGGDYTVLLSTHILPEVELLCNRVLIIDRGRIVDQGTPESLRERWRGNARLRLLIKDAPPEAEERLRALAGVHAVEADATPPGRFRIDAERGLDLREPAFRLAVERGWVLLELAEEKVSLEDIFVRLTTAEPAAAEAEPAPAPEATPEERAE